MATKWDRVDKAYHFLRSAQADGRAFSAADLSSATGWTESTVQTYATKKWSNLLVAKGNLWTVNERIKSYSIGSFKSNHTQVLSTPTSLFDLLLTKAVAACVSSIEIYNKPDFKFRNENFSILIINAWELLLKAKILLEAGDDPDSIFAKDKNGATIRSKSGNPRTISVMTAAESLHASGVVARAVLDNLRILSCIRDESVHLVANDFDLNKRLQEVGVAAVRNFSAAASIWFGYDFGQYNMLLMPLSFAGSVDTQLVSARSEEAERILRHISELQDAQDDANDPDFSVALRLDARFVKTDAADALAIRISNDPDAVPMRLTEDDVLKKFPHTHASLVEVLRSRYTDFKQNGDFNKRLAKLRIDNPGLFVERRLNPSNPRSAYQRFYGSKVVEAFDQYYHRRLKKTV